MENLVLTGDNMGQLASWAPFEMPSRNERNEIVA